MSLLEVDDLRVRFRSERGFIEAVRGVSFAMGREKLGIVGESGSGKSLTGRALLGVLPPYARLRVDRLSFDGVDLTRATPHQRRALRGGRMGMILQDPKFSLNPVMRVGRQIAEAARHHLGCSRRAARRRALEMLDAVRIRDPERVLDAYPHALSGGMGQRVMIAMMLVAGPDLLIADEPTSALDVTVQMQVLAIIDDLVTRRGMGLVFISHDLPLVASFCDRVLVMHRGEIVETCRADALAEARHPYTRRLLAAVPVL
jgi:peptide/nickel transport system ATP-binding protein